MEHQQIAALLRGDGALAGAEDAEAVAVYARGAEGAGGWTVGATIPAALDYSSPSALNKTLRALIAGMPDCRIVVGREIAGIPYHVFCRQGFEVFEADVLTDALLADILQDVAAAAAAPPEEEDYPTKPLPTSACGIYTLDLVKMQAAHPEVSSKMALKDFLKGDFKELRLTCSHVPPWLANDISLAGATMAGTPTDAGLVRVVIRKKA
ncbi:MAG: hypothetical protein LBS91_00920 [Clostridiales Family XIII bacterium]|jgi:hypothetical protein|nr:hypothetical protein [Clostridiales Family XIII bacterium]